MPCRWRAFLPAMLPNTRLIWSRWSRGLLAGGAPGIFTYPGCPTGRTHATMGLVLDWDAESLASGPAYPAPAKVS